jgi:hypothetical protein
MTNVPLCCPLCPLTTSGDAHTIWKYNAVFHLVQEHGGEARVLSDIPSQLLIDIFIQKQEELWMGIDIDATMGWREEHRIPDSDAVDQIMLEEEEREPVTNLKRPRTETASTIVPPSKRG